MNQFHNWGNVVISNNSIGQSGVSVNQTIVSSDPNVIIAWIGKSGNRNAVYMSVSNDSGRTFTSPQEITNATAGNASHLSACASRDINSIVWQQLNNTNGRTEVWGIESSDQGHHYYRSQLSPNNMNANAHDPVISPGSCENVLYTMTFDNGTNTIYQWPW
jgi:hypothetical protein